MNACNICFAAMVVLLGLTEMAMSLPNPGMPEVAEVPRVQPEWNDPIAYLDVTSQLFGQRLKEYGVENLPVVNKNFTVNDTRYNIELKGDIHYTNGFVLDVLNISRYYRQFVWYFEGDDMAFIKYKILLGDVSVLYDLHADLEIENVIGTAELNYPENLIEVLVSHNTTSKAVAVVSMTTNAVNGPKTNYAPDSSVMKAVAYNARLTMAKSLFSDLTVWIDSALLTLLESVVQDVPFPLTYTQDARRRRPYTISKPANKKRWRV